MRPVAYSGPAGYLNREETLCDPTVVVFQDHISLYDTPVTVTIPSTVGPSGRHYALIGRIINTDGSYYGSTWESDVFDLQGANGTWADYQQTGYHLWGDDGIDCTGFACVKDCAATFGTSSTGSDTNSTYNGCANACPDVSIAFGSSTYGGQPTTDLTQPTQCPEQPVTRTSGSSTEGMPTATRTTRTSTRTAAAGVSTGAASHSHSDALMFVVPLIVAKMLSL